MSEHRTVRLDHLLGVYRVGSGDWPWTEEYDNLIDQPDTQKLLGCIAVEGIREPILLGTDGRVWDGHHRIVIAMHTGIDSVPVEFAGVVAEEPEVEWEYGVAKTEWPKTAIYRRRDRESAEAFVQNPPLGERRTGWLIVKRVPVGPWLPVEQEGE